MKNEVEAVGSLLDDGGDYESNDDGFGESIDRVRDRRYERHGRSYEDGVIGMGAGDELERRAFDDAQFLRAYGGGGRRRLSRATKRAKQRAIRDGEWADVALRGSGLRAGDTSEPAHVLDGADPPPRASELRGEIADLEAMLAALTRPAPTPERPAPTIERPTRAPAVVAPSPAPEIVDDLAELEAELGLDRDEPHDEPAKEIEPERLYEAGTPARTTADPLTAVRAQIARAWLAEDDEPMDTAPAPDSRGYMPPAKSVNHMSPRCIARAVARVWPEGIDLDPFASRSPFRTIVARQCFYGPDDPDDPLDGLAEDYDLYASEQPTRLYANSPYGRFIRRAVRKIVSEVSSADVRAIALLKSCTDTPWFEEVMDTATALCFCRGRLHYIDGDTGESGPAPFPSVVILWDDERVDAFELAFGVDTDPELGRPIGRVIRLR